MKFFHISRKDGIGSHAAQAQYFERACVARDIEYVRLTEETADCLHMEVPRDGDIVYRSAPNYWGKSMERALLHEGCRHIYTNIRTVVTGKGPSVEHFKRMRLPAVPSTAFLPRRKRDAQLYADKLGGFPLVIKVSGGMEGVGVMRVDSVESFNSVADFVRKDQFAEYRVMQYIPHRYYGRLVVVGDRVVAATRDMAPIGDFRANARGFREHFGESYVYPDEVVSIAVRASHAVGVLFSGVDVMLADSGELYLTEANSPFNFAETQRITGVDIAGALLDRMQKL